jgi:hypothetical protein
MIIFTPILYYEQGKTFIFKGQLLIKGQAVV